MKLISAIFIFIFGSALGSFLNVVVERLRSKKNFITKRSCCPHCRHVLGVLDLLPLLSFLLLRGRCRYCNKKITSQYFWMELVTGMVFAIIYLSVQTQNIAIVQTQNIASLLLFQLIIACFLIIIFLYDLKYYLILDRVVVPGIIIAFIGNLLLGQALLDLLIGMAIGGGLFFLQFTVSKGKWIGGGDIRLGLFMGAILGWKNVLLALFIAYLFGAVVGIIMLLAKKKTMKEALPFGPFLCLGTFIAMLYGRILIDWYLSFLYL